MKKLLFSGFILAGWFVAGGGESVSTRDLFVLGAIVAFVVVMLLGRDKGQTKVAEGWVQEWQRAARDLGLRPNVRRSTRSVATMRGEIEGHRVSVSSFPGAEPEIEVRFQSGFRSLDIDRRRENVRRLGRHGERPTGDAAFDALYRVSDIPGQTDGLAAWLNDERREILVVLADALSVDEIEEDELEVRLGRTEWTADELAQAVRLCVLVAQVLDASHRSNKIQDAVRPSSPQDAVIQDAPLRGDEAA